MTSYDELKNTLSTSPSANTNADANSIKSKQKKKEKIIASDLSFNTYNNAYFLMV